MKRLWLLLLAASAIWAQKPVVSRNTMTTVETAFDQKIQRLSVDEPFQLLGTTRGVYLAGYGVVLTAEVNLVISTGITPFHQEYTKPEIERIHQRKLQRLPILKAAIMEQLAASAAALEAVPADEQVAIGITLFYWSWEDTTGLPRQILIQAPRKTFYSTPRAQLASAVRVQEF